MNLLINRAIYDGQWFTPHQFESKIELQNKTKKRNTSTLECPDGCEIIFKKKCTYYKRNGTKVFRQAHFSHKSIMRRDSCLVLRKYHCSGGESKEHHDTKMKIAGKENLKLLRQCGDRDCNIKREVDIPSNCYTQVEYKVNNKWLVDVAFLDKVTNEIKMVVEVQHKHIVDGVKREWLVDQDFLYFEVASNTESNTHLIIDNEDYYTYFCTAIVDDDGCFDNSCKLGEIKRESIRKAEEERKRKAEEAEEEEMYRLYEEAVKRRREENRRKEAEERRLQYIEDQKQEMLREKEIYEKKFAEHCAMLRKKEEKEEKLKAIQREKLRQRQRKEEEEKKRLRSEKRFKKEIVAHQHIIQTEEEKIVQTKKERLREKQRKKRKDMKQLELQKQTIGYQKKINHNRRAFGLKKRKLQSNINSFFNKNN